MEKENQLLEEIAKSEYEYGFVTDIETDKLHEG